MAKTKRVAIGPSFGAEIIAAGLGGLPFSWGEDGDIQGREGLTEAENDRLSLVIKMHDPALPGPYVLSKLTVLKRMTDAEATNFVRMPAKVRLMWDAVPELSSDTDLFSDVRDFLTSVASEDRATDLLAKG